MKATVLIDNITNNKLIPEWGLSVYIEHEGHTILLDTGASGSFALNATELGVNLEKVEYGVLSHAHYDHADGMEGFFGINKSAKFYLREGSAENCYGKRFIFSRYIGVKKGVLGRYSDRIEYVTGDYPLFPGVYLVPHKTPNLDLVGKKAGMYIKNGRRLIPDSFSHEQSLVIDTFAGLVIFNSCSHAGADNIIKEVAETFPNKKIRAMFGGFHLFASSDDYVRDFAKRLKQTGIEEVYTGHCSGERAMKILEDELGDSFHRIYTGFELEI